MAIKMSGRTEAAALSFWCVLVGQADANPEAFSLYSGGPREKEHAQAWQLVRCAFYLYAAEWGGGFNITGWTWPARSIAPASKGDGRGFFDRKRLEPWTILLREAARLLGVRQKRPKSA